MGTPKKKYSNEFRIKFVEDFEKSGVSLHEYCKSQDVGYSTAVTWLQINHCTFIQNQGIATSLPQKDSMNIELSDLLRTFL